MSKQGMGVVVVFIVLNLVGECASYKPVVIIHGMFDRKNSLLPLQNRIVQVICKFCVTKCCWEMKDFVKITKIVSFFSKQQKHPGTNVTVINLLHRWRSMAPLWGQVEKFEEAIQPIMSANPDGIHLIGG